MSAEADNKKDAEMAEEIRSYLRMKDYYQILGVEKDADEQKIKNSYRKLAVRFHPDKNKVEGAKQVFHKISNAYTTLVDRQSRDSYDRFGPNEEIMEREAARRQQQYRNASAEMDFDEFIFQQFFGGGMARGGTHFYQFGGRPQNHQQQPQQRGGLNMLHIFILMSIGMSILPKLFESAPFFSFQQTSEFTTARQTSVLKARYFSGSQFLKLVQGRPDKLLELERKVDAQYYKLLYHQCEAQTMQRRRYQQAAYNSYSEERRTQYLLAAEQVDLQACHRLRRIQEHHYEYVTSIS